MYLTQLLPPQIADVFVEKEYQADEKPLERVDHDGEVPYESSLDKIGQDKECPGDSRDHNKLCGVALSPIKS